MNFDELREYDRRLGEIADDVESSIPSMARNHPAGVAATALSHIVGSMASLKNAHLDLANSGNTYAGCAILRVFLEHSLKAIAIFLQSAGQNFSLAEGYMRLREVESREYLDALKKAGIEESDLKDSPLEPWLAMGMALSKSQKDKLKEPFSYRKLIDVIRSELGDTDKKSFLLKIIPNYSELSGFVHGGPTTAVIVGLRQKNIAEDAILVVSMFYSIKRDLLELAASIRPEFAADRDRLNQALDEPI